MHKDALQKAGTVYIFSQKGEPDKDQALSPIWFNH